MNDISVEVHNLVKKYPGTMALKGVDFNIYKGKVNALIGENGAGKSTMMKILAGNEIATSGEILVDGQPVVINSIWDARKYGIGIVHQEFNLFPNLTVAENIFIGKEKIKRKIEVDRKNQNLLAQKLLNKLEYYLDPKQKVGELKVGQQQIVEIVKTIAQDDLKVLIMDEPTSSLSNAEVEVLFKIIEDLKSLGISIVYISHRLEEILSISDHVSVLRDGLMIAEEKTENVNLSWIIEKMIGTSATSSFVDPDKEIGEEVLRAEDISYWDASGNHVLKGVSFSLRRGEILGIYGLLGAGRTELFETLMGMHPDAEGKITLFGKELQPKSISDQITNGFALIPEDRQREGIVQTLSIEKNLVLASEKKFTKLFHVVKKKEQEAVSKMVGALSVKTNSSKSNIMSLSGGNQQKVVIGKGLMTDPKILLMDEPTRGVDIGAKGEMFQIASNLAKQGLSIIIIASELKEIISISDRIIVLSSGMVTGEFQGDEIDEENIIRASSVGHKQKRAEL
jgi:ABC-type sugar transport system ATPase subunit